QRRRKRQHRIPRRRRRLGIRGNRDIELRRPATPARSALRRLPALRQLDIRRIERPFHRHRRSPQKIHTRRKCLARNNLVPVRIRLNRQRHVVRQRQINSLPHLLKLPRSLRIRAVPAQPLAQTLNRLPRPRQIRRRLCPIQIQQRLPGVRERRVRFLQRRFRKLWIHARQPRNRLCQQLRVEFPARLVVVFGHQIARPPKIAAAVKSRRSLRHVLRMPLHAHIRIAPSPKRRHLVHRNLHRIRRPAPSRRPQFQRHLPWREPFADLLLEFVRVSCRHHRLRHDHSGGLMLTVPAVHPAPAVDHHLRPKRPYHAHHILERHVAPDLHRLLGALRKSGVHRAREKLPHAVVFPRLQQLFCADHPQLAILLRPDRVLPALPARHGQQRHVRVQSVREVRKQPRRLIVRVRRDEQNPRCHARLLNRLRRFRQRLRTRRRARPKRPAHRQNCRQPRRSPSLHCTASLKGHCRRKNERPKYTRIPAAMAPSDAKIGFRPVERKIAAHPAIATITGSGYSFIRNGNRAPRRRSSTSPTAWPMNWIKHRIARMARITENKLKSALNKIAVAPSASSEICGNFFVGCTRPNTAKKFPSSAAAYGTREYPSVAEKIDPSAVNKISAVATSAQPLP